MATDFSLGLFQLDLPFNNPDLKKDAFKMKLLDIAADLEARKGRPEELAILNLIGVFNCRLERYKDAEEKFRDVLSKDEHNLNALANMQYLFEKLYRTVDGRRYKSKLDMYLSKSTEEAVGVRMKARCLAEQAYAYACDMHTDRDSVGRERFIESNDIFQRTLELGGDLVETAEKDFWKFCIAKNAHKIFDRLSFGEHRVQATDYMDTAIGIFYEITQKDPGDSKYQGESWRHLGDILRKVQVRKHYSCAHLPDELQKYVADPELCMKKALECDPDNPRILARYANFVYHLRHDTKEALRLLDKSITLDNSDYNFYAFSTRGTVRLKFYNWKMGMAEKDNKRHSKPDRSVLELAKIDTERAIDIRHASWDLLNIADVYHLLAQCDPDEPKESKRQYLEKEFEYLKRAADCEAGNRLISVKRLLGRCLFDLGHYRESIQLYDETLNLESATSQYTGYFYEQFRSYLCLLQSDPKDDFPLEKMAQSLRQAVAKYGTSALIKHVFGTLREEYKHEVQVFTDYCKTIPSHDSLLFVLTSNEPPSPRTPPPRPGGLLKESWEIPEKEKEDHGVGEPKKENPKTLDSLSPVVPSEHTPSLIDAGKDVAPSPDSGLEAPNQYPDEQASQATVSAVASNQTPDKPADGAAASLVEGIRSMAITDSPPEKGCGRKDFDFFVVHTASDAEWVHEELLPKLGIRKLKGCTTQEYALAGSFVLSNELHLMESSACILFVLTSGFETECEFLMHHALKLKKAGHVIFPLRRGKSAVPRELQDILFCFDATRERVNWDKLAQDIKRQIHAAKELPVHD
ncbi:tetratricopeptide repeat protein 22-like [Patiria miniata]|uniref:TIR domain-containing protein n=1 Tax=Patiria miniata TaxID=46514 RepID=A0A914BIZ9_PATMI|nr:tetratricopeptide repeat protein 22-like [Patiria miniata]